MGYKKVCIDCKKAFNIQQTVREQINLSCPNCGKQTTLFNHKFRPPKHTHFAKWKVVEFLKNHGFIYQHIYKENNGVNIEVAYPETLKEAKEFVEIFNSQAYDLKNI